MSPVRFEKVEECCSNPKNSKFIYETLSYIPTHFSERRTKLKEKKNIYKLNKIHTEKTTGTNVRSYAGNEVGVVWPGTEYCGLKFVKLAPDMLPDN